MQVGFDGADAAAAICQDRHHSRPVKLGAGVDESRVEQDRVPGPGGYPAPVLVSSTEDVLRPPNDPMGPRQHPEPSRTSARVYDDPDHVVAAIPGLISEAGQLACRYIPVWNGLGVVDSDGVDAGETCRRCPN